VLLQVAGTEKKKTRRALLVRAANEQQLLPETDRPNPGMPAYEPQPLDGEVFERMKWDPEIRAMRQRLAIGAVMVAVLMALSLVWHYVGGRPPAGEVAQRQESLAGGRSSETVTPAEQDLLPNSIALPGSVSPGDAHEIDSHGKLAFVTRGGKPIDGFAGIGRGPSEEKLAQAKEVIVAFLRADTVDALLQTVANGSRIEAALRAYYQAHALTPTHYADIQRLPDSSVAPGEVPMLVTLSTGRRVLTTVLFTADGHPGVDWPSFVGLSDMGWDQFLASRPTTAVMFRVMAEAGDWYTGKFADSQQFLSVKLTGPQDSASAPCFAYVERNGAAGKEMGALLREHFGPFPVTLRLKFPEDIKGDKQSWIESVESHCWFVRPEDGITQAGKPGGK